jgi:hypothetical protein
LRQTIALEIIIFSSSTPQTSSILGLLGVVFFWIAQDSYLVTRLKPPFLEIISLIAVVIY